MNCDDIRELLARAVFGELEADGEEGRGLSAHLADCPACARFLVEARVTAGLLGEAAAAEPEPVLSEARRAALMAAAAAEPASMWPGAERPGRADPRGRRWPTGVRYLPHAAAIILVVVMLGVLMTPGARRHAMSQVDEVMIYPSPCTSPGPEARVGGVGRREPVYDERRPRDVFKSVREIEDGKKKVDRPVVVHEEVPGLDRFETANEMDKDTARGQEDRLSDIPLGGTGVIGSMGVGGGGMTGSFGYRDGSGRKVTEPVRRPGKPGPAPAVRDLSTEAPAERPVASPKPAEAQAPAAPTTEIPPPAQTLPDDGRQKGEKLKSDDPRRARTDAPASGPGAGMRETGDGKSSEALEKALTPAEALDLSKSPRMLSAQAMLESRQKASIESKDPEAGKLPAEQDSRAPFVRLSPEEAKPGDALAVVPEESPRTDPVPAGETQGRAEESVPESVTEKGSVFKVVPVNPFVMTANDRLSTFSIDVDTASYSIARRYIAGGCLPPIGAVRMEEFVNAFDYNYPRNSTGTFSVISEAAPAPFGQGLVLLKVGVRGRVIGREGRKPAHLVFVVDSSGSMDQPDRMPLVKYALKSLVGQLGPADRREEICAAIDAVQCGGSTNLVEGLSLGYRLAGRDFRTGGINRVVLCSDGAANIGITGGEEIVEQVRKFRDQGVTFTGVGFGMGTYNDALLEKLADSGDGSYVFVDSRREARRVFVEEMAATLQTIAKDVKIQVDFEPGRVRRYRLIGYENRDVEDARFRDDTVDAGEVGSGQSATALYELELNEAAAARGGADLGTVYVRYRNLDTGRVEEISHRLEEGKIRARTPETDPRFFLAACAAEFAELLRESEHAAGGSFDELRYLMEKVAAQPALSRDVRVQELLALIRRAKGLPRAR